MGTGDFFHLQSNNKKLNFGNLKQLNLSDLGDNENLIKIFNIFDKVDMNGNKKPDGILSGNELNSLFDAMSAVAQSKGNYAVLETSEADEYIENNEELKSAGIKASDLFDFLTKLVPDDKQTSQNNHFGHISLTDEEAKEAIISEISKDAADALGVLMRQDNGNVSNLYDKYKSWKDSDLALSNIQEAVAIQHDCADNLYLQKKGN